MPFPKKIIPLLSFFCITVSLWCLDHYFGLLIASVQPPNDEDSNPSDTTALLSETNISTPNWNPTTKYESGPLKPPGSTYIKTIIVPKTKNDDVDWIFSNFGEDPQIQSAIYVVDDPSAELHTPRNKGHEVLAYLSFIVEQYENLSDVNIFLHSHRFAWHNNELLSHDAVQMISRLSSERVQREGYMNLRCAWEPGCVCLPPPFSHFTSHLLYTALMDAPRNNRRRYQQTRRIPPRAHLHRALPPLPHPPRPRPTMLCPIRHLPFQDPCPSSSALRLLPGLASQNAFK